MRRYKFGQMTVRREKKKPGQKMKQISHLANKSSSDVMRDLSCKVPTLPEPMPLQNHDGRMLGQSREEIWNVMLPVIYYNKFSSVLYRGFQTAKRGLPSQATDWY